MSASLNPVDDAKKIEEIQNLSLIIVEEEKRRVK